MTDALEIPVRHRCHLARLVDELADHARRGERGERLAERTRTGVDRLLVVPDFDKCCVPRYLELAPEVFAREIQIPVASAEPANLDARVLLWPIGAKDARHPHANGWAVFAVVRGTLASHEEHDGLRQPERTLPLRVAELLQPTDGVTHHIHNRGDDIGISVHVFGT